MNSYVRVDALCKNPSRSGDRLYFDLRLVDGKVSRRFLTFGWQNDSGEPKPFVIESDGRVNFGEGYKEDRYGSTDLFDCEISIGANIEWSSHDYLEKYSVVSIKSLDQLV